MLLLVVFGDCDGVCLVMGDFDLFYFVDCWVMLGYCL